MGTKLQHKFWHFKIAYLAQLFTVLQRMVSNCNFTNGFWLFDSGSCLVKEVLCLGSLLSSTVKLWYKERILHLSQHLNKWLQRPVKCHHPQDRQIKQQSLKDCNLQATSNCLPHYHKSTSRKKSQTCQRSFVIALIFSPR